MIGTPEQTSEVSFKNPRKIWSDSIPSRIKVFWKKSVANLFGNHYYSLIIPSTENHTSWRLGAQPDSITIEKLYKDEAARSPGGAKKVHIVSMLAQHERVITDEDRVFSAGLAVVDRKPWFDHGVLNLKTWKNETVAAIREFQKPFYAEFIKNPSEQIFYCHCMAGRSRSYLQTMAFLYFYPDKEKLFDFKNWPSNIANRFNSDLKKRLCDDPSFGDIAEFMKIQRPKVKALLEMDGDQAGLIGLMSLSRSVEQLDKIERRAINRLYRDARDIGLMLMAPLDRNFRDLEDIHEQERNLIAVYNAYKNSDINLLMAMVVSVGESEIVNPEDNFEENFYHLLPTEQARFAILMQKLVDSGCDLKPFKRAPIEYVKQSLEQIAELTSGDMIEILRIFGDKLKNDLGFGYKDVVKKILTGKALDRHNAGFQLAEILHMTTLGDPAVDRAISSNELSYAEQVNFIRRLVALGDHRAKYFAEIVQENYKRRGFLLFNNPLSGDQIKILESAIKNGSQFYKKESVLSQKGSADNVQATANTASIISMLGKRIEVDLKQFGSWIDQVKESLESADKKRLVEANMGDPRKLEIVLAVCSRRDLGDELLVKLSTKYQVVEGGGDECNRLAQVIANLPELRESIAWRRRSYEVKQEVGIEQESGSSNSLRHD